MSRKRKVPLGVTVLDESLLKPVAVEERPYSGVTGIKLDIGCGLNQKKPLEEWVHLDANAAPHIEIVCDFASIPLDDGSVDEIWLGDVIEHVPGWREEEVLREWHRILRPGGIIGGQTPHILKTVDDFVKGLFSLEEALVPRVYGWADRPTEIHYITHSKDSLTELFGRHGFDVSDYTSSPGSESLPWWLVFRGTRI